MAEFKSPAEESATNILEGVQILQKYNPKATLVALDKAVYCDGPSPDDDGDDDEEEDTDEESEGKKFTAAVVEQLEDLGWEWDEEQGAWGYYTGHG